MDEGHIETQLAVVIERIDGMKESMNDRFDRIDDEILGNGSPGLMERMASAETNIDNLKELKPTSMKKTATIGTASAGIVTILLAVATKLLGII